MNSVELPKIAKPAEHGCLGQTASVPARTDERIPVTHLQSSGLQRRIFKAASVVGLASLTVKAVALLKDSVVAAQFGRSDAIDAFLIAFMIPGLLMNLFSESMNQALIPTLVRVRTQQGKIKAQELLSSSMLIMCSLLTAGSIFMAILTTSTFHSLLNRFSQDKLNLTESIFYTLLPMVVLGGIASSCAAVLNSCETFAIPALAPLLMPLCVLLSALSLSTSLGIWALVVGNLVGSLLLAGLSIWLLHQHDYRIGLRWHGWNSDLREVSSQYGPVILSGLVASSGLLVDQAMASRLSSGSVATLAYGNRFVGVLLSLMAGGLSTALTPHFCQLTASRNWPQCRNTVNTWVCIAAITSLPVAAALFLGSHQLVQLTYQHGSFNNSDTLAVSTVQMMYAIQLPFFIVSRVFYRYLLAIRKGKLILICGVLNLGLDIVLNLLCMHWYGVAGIALATSLWTVSTFLFLGYWTYHFLRVPMPLQPLPSVY